MFLVSISEISSERFPLQIVKTSETVFNRSEISTTRFSSIARAVGKRRCLHHLNDAQCECPKIRQFSSQLSSVAR